MQFRALRNILQIQIKREMNLNIILVRFTVRGESVNYIL